MDDNFHTNISMEIVVGFIVDITLFDRDLEDISPNDATPVITISVCYYLKLHDVIKFYLGVQFFSNKSSIGCSYIVEHK